MVQIRQFATEYASLLFPLFSERVRFLHQFIVKCCRQAQVSLKYKMPSYEVESGWFATSCRTYYVSITEHVPRSIQTLALSALQYLHFHYSWRLYGCAWEYIQPYTELKPKVNCGTDHPILTLAMKLLGWNWNGSAFSKYH